MIIRIEKSSAVPITRQILDQIRAQCASGALKPDDRLPSVRELARELTVNQNTILRVYERLESEGLVELRHGAGTFVSAQAIGNAMGKQRERLRLEAVALARHAASLGVKQSELRRILDEACASERQTDKKGKVS